MDIRVICGEFTPEALPINISKHERAKVLIEQGADAVIELPTHCVLNTQDTYTFAKVAMLEKIRCSEIFDVYCQWDEPELLCDIALDIFKIERDKQREIAQMKRNGMEKWEIRGRLSQEKYPDTKELFMNERNIKALEYLISHKSIYSGMKVKMHVGLDPARPVAREDMATAEGIERFHKILLDIMQGLLKMGKEEAIKYMLDIYGGMQENAEITYAFFEEREKDKSLTLSDLTIRLGRFAKSDIDTRIWLLRNIFVIRNIDNIIYGNNTYVPYGRVLAVKDDSVLEKLKERSWITLIQKNERQYEPDTLVGDYDDSKHVLFEIDKKAEELMKIC